jgi:nucleotide-binding universal stress UspA family protein
MSVPAVRHVVVGVDGSAESAAALRWACREASLRSAEVHAVHVREAKCYALASYAGPASASPGSPGSPDDDGVAIARLWRSVMPGPGPCSDVEIRTEVVDGLAARVLLDRCAEADMLVLGTVSDPCGAPRSAGPVIRACLRRAPCPVVVISAAQDPISHREPSARAAQLHVKVPAIAGV